MEENNEWKINTWWKKTLIVSAMIQGALGIIGFIYGFVLGFMGIA